MWRFFNMAREVAISRKDKRSFLIGCVAVRNDGALVRSRNSPVVMGNVEHTSYPRAHAEFKISKKLDVGAIVFVCRIRELDGKYKLARPCPSCQMILRNCGVKTVYYTINDVEYGVLDLDKMIDKVRS